MRGSRDVVAFVALWLWSCAGAVAGTPDLINTLPTSGASFYSQLQTFLKLEDANRFGEQFAGFVVSGGVASTSPTLTTTPTAVIAYANGYRVTESGSVTLPANRAACHINLHQDTTGDVTAVGGTWTRVPGTHWIYECGTASNPTGSPRIFNAVTGAASITGVTDQRQLGPVGTTQLQSLAVTSEKIALANVCTDQLCDEGVTAGKIDTGAVDATQLAVGGTTGSRFSGTISNSIACGTSATRLGITGQIPLSRGETHVTANIGFKYRNPSAAARTVTFEIRRCNSAGASCGVLGGSTVTLDIISDSAAVSQIIGLSWWDSGYGAGTYTYDITCAISSLTGSSTAGTSSSNPGIIWAQEMN